MAGPSVDLEEIEGRFGVWQREKLGQCPAGSSTVESEWWHGRPVGFQYQTQHFDKLFGAFLLS